MDAEEFDELEGEPTGGQPTADLTTGEAEKVTAESLVSADKDRPIADNKIEPPPLITAETPRDKKRGRPKMTEEQKVAAKTEREKRGRADFSDITATPSGGPKPETVISSQPTRNYFQEACEMFIPLSFAAGKFMGPHWEIPIKDATLDKEGKTITPPCLDFTEEQKQLLQSWSRWLEYEQFPPMNARLGFFISMVAYTAPKFRQKPTPEKLKVFSDWCKLKALAIYNYFKK